VELICYCEKCIYVLCGVAILHSVLIDSGSRYEVLYPSGISHFLEKLAFQVRCYAVLISLSSAVSKVSRADGLTRSTAVVCPYTFTCIVSSLSD